MASAKPVIDFLNNQTMVSDAIVQFLNEIVEHGGGKVLAELTDARVACPAELESAVSDLVVEASDPTALKVGVLGVLGGITRRYDKRVLVADFNDAGDAIVGFTAVSVADFTNGSSAH